MNNQPTQVNSGGVGFLGLLTVLFIGLKLGGVISWSWWWVLAPLWGPFALILGLSMFGFFVATSCQGLISISRRFRR